MKALRASVAAIAIMGAALLMGCNTYEKQSYFQDSQASAVDLGQEACEAYSEKDPQMILRIQAQYAKAEDLYESERKEAKQFLEDNAKGTPDTLPSLAEQMERLCPDAR